MSLADEIDELAEGLHVLEPRSQFDPCVIGVVQQGTNTFVVYSMERVIEMLVREDDMTEEDAREHFSFNMLGSWIGDDTPGYLTEIHGRSDDLPVRDLPTGD